MSEEKVSDQPTVSPDEVATAAAAVATTAAAVADADANPISASDLADNGGPDSLHKQELGFTEEELRRNLETIASTGKFWTEWDKLKSMLSFKLKQVLSEYNEGKMPVEEQNSCLGGETYLELMQRLDEALLSFDEGPPFTLQRLCEILLTAQSIYPKLRKLALALEKNLFVSSMLLTSYADPSPNPASNNMVLETEVPKNGEMEKSSNEENGVDNTVVSSTTTTAAAAAADEDDEGMVVDVEVEEAKDHQEEAKDHQEEEISSMDTEEAAVVEEVAAAGASAAGATPSPSLESEMKPSSEPTE